MNRIPRIFVLFTVLLVGAANAQLPSKATSIPPSGNTTLETRSTGLNIRVVITTTDTKRASGRGDPRFYAPKSWVDNIVITVNGEKVGVPLSAFLDVFDLHQAEIRVEGTVGVLTLRGGDASLSHWTGIEFDSQRVTRRRSGPTVPAGAVTEETTYRTIVVE